MSRPRLLVQLVVSKLFTVFVFLVEQICTVCAVWEDMGRDYGEWLGAYVCLKVCKCVLLINTAATSRVMEAPLDIIG